MQIKFPLLECDEELDGIADSIDCKIFVPQDTLQKFTFQLRKIKSSLDKNDHHTPYEIIIKKRKLVEKLSARCEKLRQRNIVISYAERAEEIANMSPFLTDDEIDEKAIELADCIHRFVQTTRPSKNNMKFPVSVWGHPISLQDVREIFKRDVQKHCTTINICCNFCQW